MRILLIGDVHGDFTELQDFLARVRALFRIGAAIQVGDFGFFEKSFSVLERGAVRFPVPLHVIDGNHENHSWLCGGQDSGLWTRWKDEFNLHYQPRGSVHRFGSSQVGFMGGALNFDQPQQQNAQTDSSNYIRSEEVQRAASACNAAGADLMVSHTCPSGIGIKVPVEHTLKQGVVDFVVSAGMDPGSSEDCGDVQLTSLWEQLKEKPRAWVFGHFHRQHEARVGKTQFLCLGRFKSRQIFPVVLWDTEERALVSIADK